MAMTKLQSVVTRSTKSAGRTVPLYRQEATH